MPATLVKSGDQLEIDLSSCRGSEFQDAKDKIKDIPGRRWQPENKVWVLPAHPQTADRILKTIRPEADQSLIDWIVASRSHHDESLTTPVAPDDGKLLIPWAYKRTSWQPEVVNDNKVTGLLPHQRPAVKAIAERKRILLADDVGLGKTIISLSAIEEFKLREGQKEGPVLIAAPASVMGGWMREIRRWLPPETEAVIIPGGWAPKRRLKAFEDALEANAYIIVNHEQLRIEKVKQKMRNGGSKTVTQMKNPLLEEVEWLAVVADEVHRFKNPKAAQSKGLWRVSGQVQIGATATAIMNSPDEMWSPLRWLYPTEFHERGMAVNATAYSSFYQDYVDFYEDHFKRKIVTGVKNPDQLKFVIKDKLIRRTAAILGLKGKHRYYDDFDLNEDQQKLYDEAEASMWLAVSEQASAGNKDALAFAQAAMGGDTPTMLWRIPNGAARFVRLQQVIENSELLGGPDSSASMDSFEAKFEATGEGTEPWVVFCKFKDSCEILARRLREKYDVNVGVYTGDVQPYVRTELEDEFQRGELDVMVGTIDAMKEGITLTRSHLQYWLSRSWVPAHNEQGEGRCDRLGQQELVRVYIAHPRGTVSTESVHPKNKLKEGIVATVLDKDTIKEG